MRASLALLCLLTFLLPSTGAAATLRCGTELVSDNATKAEVLLKCGEPMSRETRTEYDSATHTVPDGAGGYVEATNTAKKEIEEWLYNFGPYRLMQTVVFENGRLKEVRSGAYGR
jgi:hypothetical protein